MSSSERADVAGLVDTALRLRAVRQACRRFLELQRVQDTATLVQILLDELLEPGRAKLEAALAAEPKRT